MKRKTRLAIGGFCIAVVLMLTLCGLAAVDLSSERYMPGRFGSLLQITALDSRGMEFSLAGREYLLRSEPLYRAEAFAREYPVLLPVQSRLAAIIGQRLYGLWQEYGQNAQTE